MNKRAQKERLLAIKKYLNKKHIESNLEVKIEEPKQEEETNKEIIKLPKKMNPKMESWESLGFTFEENPEDLNTYYAILPEGYSIRSFDNSKHKEIINTSGEVRATVYSNGSIYSENDYMYLNPRYGVQTEDFYLEDCILTRIYFGNSQEILSEVYEVKEPLHPSLQNVAEFASKKDEYIKKVAEFGNNNYPGWNDVYAYWDDFKTYKK